MNICKIQMHYFVKRNSFNVNWRRDGQNRPERSQERAPQTQPRWRRDLPPVLSPLFAPACPGLYLLALRPKTSTMPSPRLCPLALTVCLYKRGGAEKKAAPAHPAIFLVFLPSADSHLAFLATLPSSDHDARQGYCLLQLY